MLEQTIEQRIDEATADYNKALKESVLASRAETEAQMRKKKAHYDMQQANQRLNDLRSELMEINYEVK